MKQKGLSALHHGKLNINALMSVAVTGTFVIGQRPEAAMVMALYAIAELIEAKAEPRAQRDQELGRLGAGPVRGAATGPKLEDRSQARPVTASTTPRR